MSFLTLDRTVPHATPPAVRGALSGIGASIDADVWDLVTSFVSADVRYYTQAVDTLLDRLTYNECPWDDYYVWHNACYLDRHAVKDIVNTYMVMAKRSEIPEYPNPDSVNAAGQVGYLIIAGITAAVAARTGYEDIQVSKTLWQLYWATADDSIPTPRFIHPLSWDKSKEDRAVAPENQFKPAFGLTFGELGEYLKWILILGGVAAAGYYGWQFYNVVKQK